MCVVLWLSEFLEVWWRVRLYLSWVTSKVNRSCLHMPVESWVYVFTHPAISEVAPVRLLLVLGFSSWKRWCLQLPREEMFVRGCRRKAL